MTICSLRAGGILAACVATVGCGETGALPPMDGVPVGPPVRVELVEADYLTCSDPCGMIYTYRTKRVDTGEPVATTRRLSANVGTYPRQVETVLPSGEAEFMWEFPRPRRWPQTHVLEICPPAGECVRSTVTLFLPPGAGPG